jgi:drug/metabolite transporter (DMT)-like permease
MSRGSRVALMPAAGVLICLASATAFGAMGVFGTLAYDEGATVGTLLSVRFGFAAALFWALVALTPARRALRTVTRRDAALAFALGAIVYSAQAGCYFAALRRIDAGLLGLLVYTFPAMVAVTAVVLGRERGDGRTALSLVIASAGLALVLGGAGAGALDPLGTALGLGTAVVYSAYTLSSAGIANRLDPLVLSAMVCTGAAVTLTSAAAAAGDLHPAGVSAAGLGWLAAIAVVSTVGAVGLFFAGLARVGPTAASILSAAAPLTTVALAAVVRGATLGPLQLAGVGLVVGAVLVLAMRRAGPGGARAPRRRPTDRRFIMSRPSLPHPAAGRSPS